MVGRGRGRGKAAREQEMDPAPGGGRTQFGPSGDHPRGYADSRIEKSLENTIKDMSFMASDASTLIAPKIQPGTRKSQEIQVVSNMHQLKIEADKVLYRYEVEINAVKRDNKMTEITRGAANDYFYTVKRELCCEIYKVLIAKYPRVFTNIYAFIYDRMRILFSHEKLNIPVSGKSFTIELTDFGPNVRENLPNVYHQFVVKCAPSVEQPDMFLDDFTGALERDLEQRVRSQQQALEIITSQVMFFETRLAFGNRFYDIYGHRDELPDGRYLLHGIQKNVRIVEGAGDGPVAVLQCDVKKAAIFTPASALDHAKVILKLNDLTLVVLNGRKLKDLDDFFKGLAVRSVHCGREFLVVGVTSRPLRDLEFNMPMPTKIIDYFLTKHKLNLKFGNLPCLIERNGSCPSFHPIELCEVLDNQKVPIDKQTPSQMQAMIQKSALVPAERIKQINIEIGKTKLFDNEFLKKSGVTVSEEMLRTWARVLPPPIPRYHQGSSSRVDNGKWNMRYQKFIRPVKLVNWVAVSFVDNSPAKNNAIRMFIGRLRQSATEVGMGMDSPKDERNLSEEEIESYFKKCAENDIKFILFISPDEGGLHKTMKYFESQYGIQTSDIYWSTLSKMLPSRGKGNKVMENFLMKINIKLGGLCYTIDLESDQLTIKWLNSENMFVGLDVNHPPPLTKVQERSGEHMKEPSVVGICANTGGHAFDFTGDYDFQETRSEAVIVKLKEMMVEMLRRYQSNHGGKLPKVVVLFRDGVSEGQFKMVLQSEVPQIRQACIEAGGSNHGVSLTVLVVQKRHNTRLFLSNINPSSPAAEQNIPAGTVVDKVIVHPSQTEFYLNSHRTIQGTARTPKYVTLVDDSNFTQDDLQGMSYALAYGHQIVNQSVSLPAPVFGAHKVAKLGKDNYRIHITRDMSTCGSTASNCGIPEPDWVQASEKLKTTSTGLPRTKFWA